MESGTVNWLELPQEVWLRVFWHTPQEQGDVLSRVCKFFENLMQDRQLWENCVADTKPDCMNSLRELVQRLCGQKIAMVHLVSRLEGKLLPASEVFSRLGGPICLAVMGVPGSYSLSSVDLHSGERCSGIGLPTNESSVAPWSYLPFPQELVGIWEFDNGGELKLFELSDPATVQSVISGISEIPAQILVSPQGERIVVGNSDSADDCCLWLEPAAQDEAWSCIVTFNDCKIWGATQIDGHGCLVMYENKLDQHQLCIKTLIDTKPTWGEERVIALRGGDGTMSEMTMHCVEDRTYAACRWDCTLELVSLAPNDEECRWLVDLEPLYGRVRYSACRLSIQVLPWGRNLLLNMHSHSMCGFGVGAPGRNYRWILKQAGEIKQLGQTNFEKKGQKLSEGLQPESLNIGCPLGTWVTGKGTEVADYYAQDDFIFRVDLLPRSAQEATPT